MLNTQSIAAPTVSVIPATKRSVQNGGQLKEQKEVRVAAYCRVSTGDESQKTSYTEQNKFYTDLIDRTEGWTKAGYTRTRPSPAPQEYGERNLTA